LAVALAGSCCSLGWPGYFPAAGTSLAPSNSNSRTVHAAVCFESLAHRRQSNLSVFWNSKRIRNTKNNRIALSAGIADSSAYLFQPPESAGLPSAHPARLARAQVDAMLELEEPAHPIRVHIIRHRRPAQADGVLQNVRKASRSRSSSALVSRPARRRGLIPARNRLSSA
jgi:hypothetical protein